MDDEKSPPDSGAWRFEKVPGVPSGSFLFYLTRSLSILVRKTEDHRAGDQARGEIYIKPSYPLAIPCGLDSPDFGKRGVHTVDSLWNEKPIAEEEDKEKGTIQAIQQLGETNVPQVESNIYCLSVIGQIEGHLIMPSQIGRAHV